MLGGNQMINVTNEQPIYFYPSLARKIGLNEAIFLTKLKQLLEESPFIFNGEKWVYNTYEGWQHVFPFWSLSTIRRIVIKLINNEMIIVGKHHHFTSNNIKWFRLDTDKFHSALEEIEEVGTRIPFNTTPPQPLSRKHITSYQNTFVKKLELEKENPFTFYEQNGFGPVSGYVAEKIQAWREDLSDELVVEAMKVAIEYGSKRWRYVEAVLRHWVEKGYRTIEEVHAAQQAYRKRFSNKVQPSLRGFPSVFQNDFVVDMSEGENESE